MNSCPGEFSVAMIVRRRSPDRTDRQFQQWLALFAILVGRWSAACTAAHRPRDRWGRRRCRAYHRQNTAACPPDSGNPGQSPSRSRTVDKAPDHSGKAIAVAEAQSGQAQLHGRRNQLFGMGAAAQEREIAGRDQLGIGRRRALTSLLAALRQKDDRRSREEPVQIPVGLGRDAITSQTKQPEAAAAVVLGDIVIARLALRDKTSGSIRYVRGRSPAS